MNRKVMGGAVFATLLPKSAQADTFGTYTDGAGPVADGNYHTYCYGTGLNASRQDNVDSAMDYVDAWTDMGTAFLSSCNNSTTDVNFQEANLAGTVRGDYVCLTLDPSNSQRCMASRVRLDIPQLQTSSPFENNLNKTIRHEIGHSMGLRHSFSDTNAMRSGAIDGSINWIIYSSHHKDHINAQY